MCGLRARSAAGAGIYLQNGNRHPQTQKEQAMDAMDLVLDAIAETGWRDRSALYVVADYINNQQANDAFRDYLRERIEMEHNLT